MTTRSEHPVARTRPSRLRTPKAHTVVLAGILVVAAAVRFVGLRFGLPAEFRPDEDYVANRALGILAGQYDVNFFFWPSFYFYFMAPVFAVLAFVRDLLGVGPGRQHMIADAVLNPEPYLLTIRVLGASYGTLMVLVVWRLARSLMGIAGGLIAAAVAATAFLSVRESHFGLQDSPAAAVVALGLLLAVRARTQTRALPWLAAGAAAGLAAALKYHPGLVLLPIAVLAATRGWKPLFLAGASAAVTLVACSPMLFLRPHDVVASLASQFLTPKPSPQLFPTLRWYIDPVLTAGVGLPVVVLAALGALRALKRRDVALAALALHVVATLLLLGHEPYTAYFRYLLPILPSLAVLSAYGAVGLVRDKKALLVGLGLVAVAPSIHRDVAFDRLLLRTDTRELAYRWIRSHVPEGTRVATSYFGGVFHDQNLVEHNNSTGFGPAKGLIQNRLAPYRVVPLDDHEPETSAGRLTAGDVDFVVLTSRYPQQRLAAVPAGKEILFRASPLSGDAAPVYDHNDGFYVPIDGFTGVIRPGPEVVVYKP